MEELKKLLLVAIELAITAEKEDENATPEYKAYLSEMSPSIKGYIAEAFITKSLTEPFMQMLRMAYDDHLH